MWKVVFRSGVKHICHDTAGRNGVNRDPLLRAVYRQTWHKGFNGTL